jgi:serine/threonine protein kinase
MSRASNHPEGTEQSPAFLLHKEGYSIKDYRLIARIGEGSFGEVWKAERGGFEVALKILKTSMTSDETLRELKSLETLKKLHHKYLLHTENFWSDGDRLYIEMELADGGTLKDRFKICLAEGKPGIPEDELLKYFTETAKALDYLHSHRPVFLHRDIKPANVLLVQGCAKLGDFGLLRQVTGDNSSTKTQGGTIPYMAPESIKEDKFSIATDLFSFAVMYAELRQGELPFMGNNQFQICERILKEPPKLSKLFHPEEKKVLLKALAKEPEDRFASCGEFVFELNRVVPWGPAVTVPRSTATGSGPPDTGPAKTTDSKSPQSSEQGTGRRTVPSTMPEMELPTSQTPAPLYEDHGTVIGGRGTHSSKPTKPAPAPLVDNRVDTAKKHPSPALEKPKPAPLPLPKRGKTLARVLPAVLLLAMMIGVFTGIWFILNASERSAIRERIDNKKFAEAAKRIKDANKLILPSRDQLQKELADKWWADLSVPDTHEKPDRLRSLLADLNAFKEMFPQYDGINAQQQKIHDALGVSVTREIDQLLLGRKLDPAQKLLTENLDYVKDARAIQNRIDKRRNVAVAFETAEQDYQRKEFEKSKSALESLERLLDRQDDIALKNKLLSQVNAGIVAREMAHAKLMAEFDQWKTKDAKTAQAKLDDLRQFRKLHPKSWPPLPTLIARSAREWLNEAWRPLHLDKVVPADARNTLDVVKQHKSEFPDAGFQKHLAALESVVAAHEAKESMWDSAANAVIKLLCDPAQPSDLAADFWPAIVQLARNRKQFRFNHLQKIEDKLPVPQQAMRKEIATLYTLVLDRLTNETPPWFPAKADAVSCVAMFAKIDAPSDQLLALKAECLIEAIAPLAKIKEIKTPIEADWYGSYTTALVHDANLDHAAAANVLLDAFQGKAQVLKPSARSQRARDILRGAVASVKDKKTREFVTEPQAKKAIEWLTLILDLHDQSADEKQISEDLADLAFAAAKAADISVIKSAVKRMEAGNFAAPIQSQLDASFARATLLLAKLHQSKQRWDPAIEASKLCQDFTYKVRAKDFRNAADWNTEAVEIQANALYSKLPVDQKGGAKYGVLDKAIQRAAQKKPADGLHVPVVVAKLEFAATTYGVKGGFPTQHLPAAITEGKAALDLARDLADKAPKDDAKAWWTQVRRVGHVRLGDGMLTLVFLNYKTGKYKTNADALPDFNEAREAFKEARKLNYKDAWAGELAFKIGNVLYQICDQRDNLPLSKQLAAQAWTELTNAEQSLKAVSQKENIFETNARNLITKYKADPRLRELAEK